MKKESEVLAPLKTLLELLLASLEPKLQSVYMIHEPTQPQIQKVPTAHMVPSLA